MDELLRDVPPELRDRFQEIVAITDPFCDEHLDEEYKQLCRELAADICERGSPITTGKPRSWAGGIVYTVGWVNFLADPSQKPHMKMADLTKALCVSEATLMAKAKVIREGLEVHRMDPRWSRTSILESNPLVWMFEDRHGMIHDLRQAPRAVQEEAYRQGLIPFLPADRQSEEDE